MPHSYKKFDIFGLVKESHSVYNESLKIYGFTVWKSSYKLLLGLNYPGDQNSGFEILESPLGWCLQTRRSTGGVVPMVMELTGEIGAGLVGKSHMWGKAEAQECNRQGQLNSDDSSYH